MMRVSFTLVFMVLLNAFMLGSCSMAKKQQPAADAASSDSIVQVADFSPDSAFAFVKAQCGFGARVPNTAAHRKAARYLAAKLTQFHANVIVQEAQLKAFDGTSLNAKNIIAEYNPQCDRRILLMAHWDCRPWADNDADKSKVSQPVMGANDAASGVAVLLEIARQLAIHKPAVGVDILLVDAEDWGNSASSADADDTWALGTQYWVKNPHHPGYKPMYGILLDMVGAKGARFSREYFSKQYASAVLDEVWRVAALSGYSDYFVNSDGGAITDDHVFVNKAGIPTIDIIHMDTSSSTGFFPEWHTTHDTLDTIDPASLKAVGQTLLNLIFQY